MSAQARLSDPVDPSKTAPREPVDHAAALARSLLRPASPSVVTPSETRRQTWKERLMQRRTIASAVLVGLLSAGQAAHAADFCFFLDGLGDIVVKGFKPPKPDKCKTFKGAYFPNFGSIVNGSACTNATG